MVQGSRKHGQVRSIIEQALNKKKAKKTYVFIDRILFFIFIVFEHDGKRSDYYTTLVIEVKKIGFREFSHPYLVCMCGS
jgi:hypothetical protein